MKIICIVLFAVTAPFTLALGACADLFIHPFNQSSEVQEQLVRSTSEGSLFLAENVLSDPGVLQQARHVGLGLTRRRGQDLYVDKLITPSRILSFNDAQPDTLMLVDALLNSSPVVLVTSHKHLVVRTPNKDIFLQPSRWPSLRPLLEKLYGQPLPRKHQRILFLLTRLNYVNLQTGWELAVLPEAVLFSGSFVDRAATEARKSGLKLGFTVHPHRFRHLQEIALKTEEARKEAYSQLLRPTALDLLTLDLLRVTWFELRALGTPKDPLSQESSTSRFFRMADIRKTRDAFAGLYAAATNRDEEQLDQMAADLLKMTEELYLAPSELALYAIGRAEFNRLQTRLGKRDLFASPEDLRFYRLFYHWGR